MKEAELLNQGYRKYAGEQLDVYYHKDMCQHAAKCVKGNPQVFEVGRKPWILPNNGEPQQLKEIITSCPSGALQYIAKGDN